MTTPDRVITVQRIGDFYEAVGDSARTLHEVCGCTLTYRWESILAGFPHYSLAAYAARLHDKGFRLAIKPGKEVC